MKKSASSGFRNIPTLYIVLFSLFVVLSGVVLFVSTKYLAVPTQLSGRAVETASIPPVTQRTVVPTGATLLTGGKGLTNGQAMTAGNFQVEGYCPLKNLGAISFNGNDTWKCGSQVLTVSNFDEICQKTYKNTGAFVIRTGTSPTPGYNWRCYAFPATSASPTPTPDGVACGELCGGQDGGVVLPYKCADGGVCGNIANGGTSKNRCLPARAPGYVMKGGICARDPNPQVYCLNKTDGTNIKDEAGIRAACAAQAAGTTATPTPTASATPSPTPVGGFHISDLNKNGKADPDDYRLFLEDYRSQVSSQ